MLCILAQTVLMGSWKLTGLHTHTCMHTHTQTHTHTNTHTHIHTHACAHAHIHYTDTCTHMYLPMAGQLLLLPSSIRSVLSLVHTDSSVLEQTQYTLSSPPKCGKSPQIVAHSSVSNSPQECDSFDTGSSLLQFPASHIPQWFSLKTALAR